jgi:hypothetical protein
MVSMLFSRKDMASRVPWVKKYPDKKGRPVIMIKIKSDIEELVRIFENTIRRIIKQAARKISSNVIQSAHSSGSAVQYHSKLDSSHKTIWPLYQMGTTTRHAWNM